MHERQPLAGAIGIEARDVQRAVVEQRGVGLAAAWRDLVAAHELVNVFEARVLSRVHHGAAVLRDPYPRALVRGAAERRALPLHRAHIIRIDLDDPPEAVRLIRILRRVEALVELEPAEARAALAHSPASLARRQVGG